MRIIRLFLVTLIFISFSTVAQDREFEETIHILNTANGERYDDLAEGCAWAVPFVPTEIVGGGVFELEPVITSEDDGSIQAAEDNSNDATSALTAVVNNGVVSTSAERFGEIWLCVGSVEPRIDPALGDVPERAVAFAIIIGDQTYGALGSWSPKTQGGFPQEPGMSIWGGGAIVVALDENDQPGPTVGAMTYNVLDNPGGINGYYDDTIHVVITLRIFEHRDHELEAANEAMRALFN